jgi:hypothetical protein
MMILMTVHRMFVGKDFLHKIHERLSVIYQTICGCQAVKVGGSKIIWFCKDTKFILESHKGEKMSVQFSEKSSNYTNPNIKTPFGIEDILLINNNTSQNVNKNSMKHSGKNSENEEFKKILNER